MLIVGNWKAYVEKKAKAKSLASTGKRLASTYARKHTVVIAPSAPYLGLLITGKSKLGFAAQDLSLSTGGAATGEVTASQLAELGVGYAIIGHSERRAQGETDVAVLEKVRHALAQKMTPIVCIGERERDTDAQYLHFVRAQIDSVFAPLSLKERLQIVIAYEPIWAIGKPTAEAIHPQELTEMILYIRKQLGNHVPGTVKQSVRVLYGGSVDGGNARSLASGTGIDGFLVGRASTDSAEFTQIIRGVS